MRTSPFFPWLVLLLSIGLVSCFASGSQVTPLNSPAVSTPTPLLPTVMPQASHTPSATPALSTLPPTPEPSPSPTIEEVLAQPTIRGINSRQTIPVCPKEGMASQPSSFLSFDSTLIYQNDDRLGLSMVGGKPITQSQLPLDQDEKYKVLGVSPNGKWIAYIPLAVFFQNDFNLDTFEVILLSDAGEQLEWTMDTRQFVSELPAGAYFDGFETSYWINDHLIYITLFAKSPTLTPIGYYIPLPKVFDPFTGEWDTELTNRLLNQDISTIGFSPNSQRALYAIWPDRLVFWDRESDAMIWEYLELPISPDTTILWSPDGSTAVVGNIGSARSPREHLILLVTSDGKFIRTIADSTFPFSDQDLVLLSWSPDSRYLALVWENSQFLLYDVINNQHIFRCPLPSYLDVLYPSSLVWSPDSRFIAFGAYDAPLQVMEIETGEIFELLQDATPVGWSATFPVEWP